MKILAIVSAVSVAFAVACGGSTPEAETPEGGETAAAAEEAPAEEAAEAPAEEATEEAAEEAPAEGEAAAEEAPAEEAAE